MKLLIKPDQAMNLEKIEKLFSPQLLATAGEFPELSIDNPQMLDQLEEYDLGYWVRRALRSHLTVKMVNFNHDLELEKQVYPKEFRGKIHDGYRDLGIKITPKNSQNGDEILLPVTKKGKFKALLLDRDGVINKDHEYVFEYEKIKWVDGIVDLIRYANENGAKVVVLTNQSGIGRGYYTVSKMKDLHQKMQTKLESWGCRIDGWYYSPYHTDGINEYKGYSLLRKPYPGMALVAQQELDLDLENSIMIGDKSSDRLQSLDLETYFLQGNYDLSGEKNIFKNHLEIIDELKKISWP